jgi:hypothetical protein
MTDAELQAMLGERREEMVSRIAAAMEPLSPDKLRKWSGKTEAEIERAVDWREEMKALIRTVPPPQKDMILRYVRELVAIARWKSPLFSGIPEN